MTPPSFLFPVNFGQNNVIFPAALAWFWAYSGTKYMVSPRKIGEKEIRVMYRDFVKWSHFKTVEVNENAARVFI